MERTLIILKPGALQRELVGEILGRLERKGLLFIGMKMMQLTDEILSEHYGHLKDKPYFGKVKTAMSASPVIVACLEGLQAVQVVRTLCGVTNGREALPGTIRGDFSLSMEQNVIHASDSVENAQIEINRFFKQHELFNHKRANIRSMYAEVEMN